MNHSIKDMVVAIRRQTGLEFKSIPVQAYELIRLYFQRGLHPSEYYAYGLAASEVSKTELNSYVSTKWYWRNHVPKLAPSTWTPILHNKWLFQLYFMQRSFTVPRCLGFFHETAGVTLDGQPLRTTADLHKSIRTAHLQSLVCKPVGGIGGAGIMVYDQLEISDRIRCISKAGHEATLDDICQSMCSDPKNYGFLIQERVADHAFFLNINPFTASSIRIVTLRDADGSVFIPIASVRLGSKGSTVDNLSQGGISVDVDTVSGTIGRGLRRPQFRREFMETHPDTGNRFTGQVIPLWDEILDLCTRAARATPNVHAVGWDVLLSPTGPILLEGNHDWAPDAYQARNKGYLTPAVIEILRSHGIVAP